MPSIELSLKEVEKKITTLISGGVNKIIAKKVSTVKIIEMEDTNFHFDSAVLLPSSDDDAKGTPEQEKITGLTVLAACYREFEKNPDQKMLLAGHTDTKGDKYYNVLLSQKRANNVLYALRGERSKWISSSDSKHKTEDYKLILKWAAKEFKWKCDPGELNDKHDEKTAEALEAFQRSYNTEFDQSIDVDGKMGPQTWGAVFDVYMLKLEKILKTDSEGLKSLRNKLVFLEKHKAGVGCGEYFPIEEAKKDEYRSSTNRRVEILFFESGEEPQLKCHPTPSVCTHTKCDLYGRKGYKFVHVPVDKIDPEKDYKYKVKIFYPGPDFVQKDINYKCQFDLEEVPKKELKKNNELKAGEYKILIHDNHALKDSDSNSMLGSKGDKVSKPANYNANNWIRDIRPAVPFRIEVRRIKDNTEVPIQSEELLIQFELADPEEDYSEIDKSMNPARQKEWIKNFVKTFKRVPDDESSKEDDNCSSSFGGHREAGKKISPSSVLFQVPFKTANPSPAEKIDEHFSKTKILPSTDSAGKPIGISEVIFFPQPIGGDNYQFSIKVTDRNGNALSLEDENSKEIKKINTGKFTIWRKIFIDLLVTFDNVDLSYINWDIVNKSYNSAFIEVVQPLPAKIKKYNQGEWKKTVKDYFKNDVGSPSAAIRNDDSKYNYDKFFLPDFPGANDDWSWTHGEGLSKKFFAKAYKEMNLKNPRKNDQAQNDTPGLFVFLCKKLHKTSNALGMYAGDREFFMVTVGDATVTFTHEMGHAVYLRHSITDFDFKNYVTSDILNSNWLDHDQNDAIACTMSYDNDYFGSDGKTVRKSNPTEWHFCAVCLLTLRFYDRVKLSNDISVQKIIYEKFNPVEITDDTFTSIPSKTISMKKDKHIDFKALAKDEGVKNNDGNFKKDLTSMSKGRWVSDDPTIADFTTFTKIINKQVFTFSGRLKGKNNSAGKIKIHFQIGNEKSDPITVDVS